MLQISDLYNKLSKETRLITQTEMLLTERRNLVAQIEEIEKFNKKIILKIRSKIDKINKDINNNYSILNL